MVDITFTLLAAVASAVILLSLHAPWLPVAFVLVGLLALRGKFVSGRPRGNLRRLCFFHPFTNDGGGGERVLWCIVRALQELAADASAQDGSGKSYEWVVYTGDDATPESLAARAKKLFNVELKEPVEVVRLRLRPWAEASSWPHFTLLGQSLGSVALAAEALWRCTPSVFVDTAGFAFAYPVACLLGGCRVVAYTHYPTISTDMLRRVQQGASLYNNSAAVANSATLSSLKLVYYRAFAWLYGLAGSCADVAMVNSSWTEAHIRSLWRRTKPDRIFLVYPPCDTASLQKFPLERPASAERFIISVAQFRPEKNHALQLRAFAQALEDEAQSAQEETGALQGPVPEEEAATASAAEAGSVGAAAGKVTAQDAGAAAAPGAPGNSSSSSSSKPRSWTGAALSLLNFGRSQARGAEGGGKGPAGELSPSRRPLEGVRLKLVGGSRDRADEERIEMLASLAEQLGIAGKVDFCVNLPFSELQELLGIAWCGLHTMLDEHFGISIVEYMAAGVVAIANNSGGPREDILKPVEDEEGQMRPLGFLASTAEEYSAAITTAFSMLPEERMAMATRARERALTYSEDKFSKAIKSIMGGLLET